MEKAHYYAQRKYVAKFGNTLMLDNLLGDMLKFAID